METKNIVQSSANVIRITNLKKGDIYKRFEDSSYSDSMKYGIVRAIYNDGTKTFIEGVEYKKSYSNEMEASLYIIRGDKDVAIFPATVQELEDEFSASAEKIEKAIANKKEEISKLEKALETTKQLISGELAKELQTPSYKEISQPEYNQIFIARESQLS